MLSTEGSLVQSSDSVADQILESIVSYQSLLSDVIFETTSPQIDNLEMY